MAVDVRPASIVIIRCYRLHVRASLIFSNLTRTFLDPTGINIRPKATLETARKEGTPPKIRKGQGLSVSLPSHQASGETPVPNPARPALNPATIDDWLWRKNRLLHR